MKQQAIDQLKDAIHLGDTFPRRFDNINNATKEGKYGEIFLVRFVEYVVYF